MPIDRLRKIISLSVALATLVGCTTLVRNNFSTVLQNSQGRGSTENVNASLDDTVPLLVAAVERSNYMVHSVASKGDAVRMLVSQGTTLMSWGEVGRIDLSTNTQNNSRIYARVEHLQAAEGYPSADHDIMPEWMKDFASLRAVLARNRRNHAYNIYKIKSRKASEGLSASDGGGMMVGFLFGGPIGAAKAAESDDVRGKRLPYEYKLKNGLGTLDVVSFVPANTDQCVGLANNDMTPTTKPNSADPIILLPTTLNSC